MTTRALLVKVTQHLRRAGVVAPEVDAELLLAHVLGTRRGALHQAPEPTGQQQALFEELIARRGERVPLQHLTGLAPFRYLELVVGPGVFVPRPETESLVEWALERVAEAPMTRPRVVDLCTGSGAIAAALAHEAPRAQVYAVEIDDRAYDYARRNLDGTGVDLRLGDIAEAFTDLDGQTDVVVANPPYVPWSAWESVEVEARDYDPDLALWSGQDGLDTIRIVEQVAHRLLRPGGQVGCEHADVQGVAAPEVFSCSGRWRQVRDRPDLVGRPRFVTARRL